MPVTVHLRDGSSEVIRQATSCEWTTGTADSRNPKSVSRWLVCRNRDGATVATFREATVNGYQITRSEPTPRFRFLRGRERSRA